MYGGKKMSKTKRELSYLFYFCFGTTGIIVGFFGYWYLWGIFLFLSLLNFINIKYLDLKEEIAHGRKN